MIVEPGGAVAIAARPWLGAVQIAAAAARVGVLDSVEREIRLPVVALLGERRRAVADLDPLDAAVLELTRRRHVAQILAAGDGSASERLLFDRALERMLASGLHPRSDQIPHYTALHVPPVDSIRRSASAGPQ